MKLRFYSRSQCKEIPLKAWESLAERAIVSNPFYEHWNLIPALEHLEQSSKVELVTAWRAASVVMENAPREYADQYDADAQCTDVE